MILKRVEIENFGKLSSFSQDLSGGLNSICQNNGWGKTTLAAFIKAMFYGLPVTTKRNLDQNERKKYLPWQGGAYGGSLEFQCSKGIFRLERFFGSRESEDEFRLFDLSTNKPSDAFSKDIGTEMFGIDAEGFERSCFLSQSGMDAGGDNPSVTAKLTGLLEDVNDIGCFDSAMESIDKRRKFYEVKGGRGRVHELEQQLADAKSELDDCKRQLTLQADLEAESKRQKEELASLADTAKRLSDQSRLLAAIAENQKAQEMIRQRLSETEEKRTAILEAFSGKQLPTDQELESASEMLTHFRKKQAELNQKHLTEEETKELADLRRKYPNGFPTPEKLKSVRDLLRSVSGIKGRIQQAEQTAGSVPEHLLNGKELPSDALLDQARAKATEWEDLHKEAEQLKNQPQKSSGKPLSPILSGSVLLVGLILTAVTFFTALPMAVNLLCYAIPVVGVILLFFTNFKGKGAEQSTAAQIAKLELQAAERHTFVKALLDSYGVSTEGKKLTYAVAELAALTAQAEGTAAQISRKAQTVQQLKDSLANSQRQLADFFRHMGYSGLPDDPDAAYIQILSDSGRWKALNDKGLDFVQTEKAGAPMMQKLQASLTGFLNRLSDRSITTPEDRLNRMKELCSSHAAFLGEIGRNREDLKALQAESPRVSAPLPSAEELQRLESENTAVGNSLSEAVGETNRKLDRVMEITQKIPDLEDRVSYLTEEWKEAEESLKILKDTARLLEESKVALSTRYLKGMQEEFTACRKLIDGENIAQAGLDISFDVSVREGGKSRVIESYSRGSRDILQFCARLALIKALFAEGELPFLILDDPFVNLDREHFHAVRQLLDRLSSDYQILYLVCHPVRS